MLTIRPTPNLAGMSISGDYHDLLNLYDALLEIVGEEAKPGHEYEMPVMQIHAICFELREAWQGNRCVEFVENGFDINTQHNLKTIGPQRNVYFSTRIFLPQMLFAAMALCDFVEMASREQKIPALNRDIQTIQLFQAEIATTLQDQLDAASAKLLAQLIYGSVPRYRSFCTQYVDMLTEKYLKQTTEKRRLQILTIARRLNELGTDYQRLVAELAETAAELECSIADLETVSEPPTLADREW